MRTMMNNPQIADGKWRYIRWHAERTKSRFICCNGVIYEVTKTTFPTGPSPLWSVDEVRPVDVPAFKGPTDE